MAKRGEIVIVEGSSKPPPSLAQLMTGNPIHPHRRPAASTASPSTQKDNSLASTTQQSGIEQNLPGFYRLACPAPSRLNKDTKTNSWQYPPYWKSYQTSLSDKIDRFLGAQWSGATLGNLICLYQPASVSEFPVQLHFSDLVDSLDDWSVQDLMKVLSQSHLTKSYQ